VEGDERLVFTTATRITQGWLKASGTVAITTL
jgi:hypothetical protein